MISYDIDMDCPKCNSINEIHYGQFDGMGGCFDNMPNTNCWKCGELIQLDLNTNEYKIKETKFSYE